MRIIDTDNFCGDYPDEKFLNLPRMSELVAQEITDVINKHLCHENSPRIWRVVENDYILEGGFEP